MTGIYKITNKVNGHCYIGQSTNITNRWQRHKNYPISLSNYPLYRAFQKYGIDNFTFEVLEECSSESLDEREIFYIHHFNSYEDGYNQTEGGAGTKSTVVKISKEDLSEIYELLLYSKITQREIAQQYNVGEDTISEINQGKTRILKGFTYPLRNNRRIAKYCIDCGVEITSRATRCDKCEQNRRRVVERPTREELKKDIKALSFLAIGRKYSVSDNTIRKWCRGYGLPTKKADIKVISEEKWKMI